MGTTVLEVPFTGNVRPNASHLFFSSPHHSTILNFLWFSSRSFNKNFHFDSRASFGITE